MKTIGFAELIAIMLYSASACAQTVPNLPQGIYYKPSNTAQPVEIELVSFCISGSRDKSI